MEIIRIPLYSSNIPVPDEGKRADPNEPPLQYGLENMRGTYALAYIADPENIQVKEGTAMTAIGVSRSLNIAAVSPVCPIFWLNTGSNKLKFRLKATFTVAYAGTLDDLLSLYNCIVVNTSISATPYGGFLVLTIGRENADLILSEANIVNGKFIATVNRVSEEF